MAQAQRPSYDDCASEMSRSIGQFNSIAVTILRALVEDKGLHLPSVMTRERLASQLMIHGDRRAGIVDEASREARQSFERLLDGLRVASETGQNMATTVTQLHRVLDAQIEGMYLSLHAAEASHLAAAFASLSRFSQSEGADVPKRLRITDASTNVAETRD